MQAKFTFCKFCFTKFVFGRYLYPILMNDEYNYNILIVVQQYPKIMECICGAKIKVYKDEAITYDINNNEYELKIFLSGDARDAYLYLIREGII